MNALGLATRGYLCGGPFWTQPPPGISNVATSVPGIVGAKDVSPAGPQMVGSVGVSPIIRGTELDEPHRGAAPSITGSGDYVPIIRKKE